MCWLLANLLLLNTATSHAFVWFTAGIIQGVCVYLIVGAV